MITSKTWPASWRKIVFPVGRFSQFVIHDPKERIITAPCFAERVLHHAVMNVCEPKFEQWLINDTYACRVGRGQGAALSRAQQFARRFPFFLKIDVRKYFDSISHEILLSRLDLLFKDRRLLDLFERIVHSFRGNLGRGLPIGSLTSQHLANFYLGWFDRYAKETLRLKGYVRYMDDMALWADSSEGTQNRPCLLARISQDVSLGWNSRSPVHQPHATWHELSGMPRFPGPNHPESTEPRAFQAQAGAARARVRER